MPENSARKPPTDFTIDCILSKTEHVSSGDQKSPTINYPMNKVLDNPWISKFPSALTFKPTIHKKFNFPPSTIGSKCFNLNGPQDYSKTFLDVARNFTSVNNHFYSSSISTSSDSTNNSDDSKLLLANVYEKNSCDADVIRNNLSLSLSEKCSLGNEEPSSPSLSSLLQLRCSVCSKTFETVELLDVRIIVSCLFCMCEKTLLEKNWIWR